MTPIEEGDALLGRLGAALYKALLRTALERARGGDVGDLLERLPMCRREAEREAREAEKAEAQRREVVIAFARGKNPAKLLSEHAKLRRAQDAAYRRWGQRRPDERTARKAHLSNALDGRARTMALLEAAYEHLTGQRMPTERP